MSKDRHRPCQFNPVLSASHCLRQMPAHAHPGSTDAIVGAEQPCCPLSVLPLTLSTTVGVLLSGHDQSYRSHTASWSYPLKPRRLPSYCIVPNRIRPTASVLIGRYKRPLSVSLLRTVREPPGQSRTQCAVDTDPHSDRMFGWGSTCLTIKGLFTVPKTTRILDSGCGWTICATNGCRQVQSAATP